MTREFRKCRKCNLDKWREDFPKRGGNTCIACGIASLRQYKKGDPEYFREYRRRRKEAGNPVRTGASLRELD